MDNDRVLEFTKKPGTYSHDICCPNCFQSIKMEISKGTLVAEKLNNFECPKCGCTANQFIEFQRKIAKTGGLLGG